MSSFWTKLSSNLVERPAIAYRNGLHDRKPPNQPSQLQRRVHCARGYFLISYPRNGTKALVPGRKRTLPGVNFSFSFCIDLRTCSNGHAEAGALGAREGNDGAKKVQRHGILRSRVRRRPRRRTPCPGARPVLLPCGAGRPRVALSIADAARLPRFDPGHPTTCRWPSARDSTLLPLPYTQGPARQPLLRAWEQGTTVPLQPRADWFSWRPRAGILRPCVPQSGETTLDRLFDRMFHETRETARLEG